MHSPYWSPSVDGERVGRLPLSAACLGIGIRKFEPRVPVDLDDHRVIGDTFDGQELCIFRLGPHAPAVVLRLQKGQPAVVAIRGEVQEKEIDAAVGVVADGVCRRRRALPGLSPRLPGAGNKITKRVRGDYGEFLA